MAKTKRKDFLAVAQQRIIRPADQPLNFSILVYGRNKRGKSTLGVSGGIDRTLVVDPEAGTKTMLHKNPYVWPMGTWADLDEIYGALRTGQLSPRHLQKGAPDEPFSIVSLDGVTKINNICLKHVMKVQEDRDLDRQPGFVQQRDYGKSGELMKEMFQKFQTLPMVKIYTAQERMIVGGETFNAGDEDEADEEDAEVTWVPDLPKGVRGDLEGAVDIIGRITAQKVEVKGKPKIQRRLYIGVHEGLDTGFRSDFDLPPVIKYPTIPKIIKLMSEGKA